MCWSRKGVPGSKRSGGAGTPFLGPAAEPNFGSERAAGSSDRGSPHERRPQTTTYPKTRTGGPAIARPLSWATLSAARRRETNSLCEERGQVVLDQAWLADAGLLAKHRRQARHSPHHPVTGEDLLAAGEQDPLPGRVGVFVSARVLARGVVSGEGLIRGLDQTIQRTFA